MSSVPCGMGNFDEDMYASTFYLSAYQYDRSKVKVCEQQPLRIRMILAVTLRAEGWRFGMDPVLDRSDNYREVGL